jgi:hypothetical protein
MAVVTLCLVLELARQLKMHYAATQAPCTSAIALWKKPTFAELIKAGAVLRLQGGQVCLVDSDFFFDRASARLLLEFQAEHCSQGMGEIEIDSGLDILMQLAGGRNPLSSPRNTVPDHALQKSIEDIKAEVAAGNFSHAPELPRLQQQLAATKTKQIDQKTGHMNDSEMGIRRRLHMHLQGSATQIHAAVLLPSSFYHIGTMKEYLQYYSGGIPELHCQPRIYNAHTRLASVAASRMPGTILGNGSWLPVQDFDGAAVLQCLLPEAGAVTIMKVAVVESSSFAHCIRM